jgi:predicted small metal-binding protein
MAFKLVCAETGAKCPFEVTSPTKDELMQHVAIHAKMSHPEMAAMPLPAAMVEKMIAKMIHEV